MFYQGQFDGLCGIYSILNAFSALTPELREDDCKDVFRSCCNKLYEEDRLLGAVGGDGIQFQALGRAFDIAAEEVFRLKNVKLKRNNPPLIARKSLDDFWLVLKKHIDEHGPGSVILGIGGRYDHWTCIQSIGNRRITLIDSMDLKRINRASCMIPGQNPEEAWVLFPTRSYFVSRSNGS